MAVEATCDGCGKSFEATRRTAKWCSDRCRKAKKRAGSPESAPATSETATVSDGSGENRLQGSVRAELEKAGVADTFFGQLAIALAKRISSPDESGISALSKELRTVMAAALEGSTPEPDPAAVEGESTDEVSKAREARERKAREAANRA